MTYKQFFRGAFLTLAIFVIMYIIFHIEVY